MQRVEIVQPDPAWPLRFEEERERIAPLLPGCEIHHVGSTAVAGLVAKPIIDLMALVDDLDEPIARLVDEGGYVFPAELNATIVGRRYLTRPSMELRTHNLHLVAERAALARYLEFRDRLRSDAALREEYAALKLELAERLGHDRDAYTEAKGPFVQRVTPR
jgi:GrpB-like predicted nucleotidyltransferase (UPF0157 family)